MDRPILTTKIRVPPAQRRVLRRDRFAHTFRKGPIPPLTLISAPAGFGKTTCAREIADAFPGRVAWFAIDPEDGDPSRFYTYFLASLREAVPELSARSLQALDSSSAPAIPSILTMLVNEFSELDEPVCAVLDDLHLVSNEAIYENLEFLLTHGAPRFHLVIVSRADPPFNLARLRANGNVLEIRSRDLRFTTAEISSFFTSRFGEVVKTFRLGVTIGFPPYLCAPRTAKHEFLWRISTRENPTSCRRSS